MLRILAEWSSTLGMEQDDSSPFTRAKMEVEQIDLGFEPEGRSLSHSTSCQVLTGAELLL